MPVPNAHKRIMPSRHSEGRSSRPRDVSTWHLGTLLGGKMSSPHRDQPLRRPCRRGTWAAGIALTTSGSLDSTASEPEVNIPQFLGLPQGSQGWPSPQSAEGSFLQGLKAEHTDSLCWGLKARIPRPEPRTSVPGKVWGFTATEGAGLLTTSPCCLASA